MVYNVPVIKMIKFRRYKHKVIPYNQENIDKFKDPDNMLKHAKCNDDTFGWMFVDRKSDELIGYVGCEGDMVVALEVVSDYKGKGYASRLLKLAQSRDANKLSVNKDNKHAIDVYRHLGYNVYDKDDAMLYMKKRKAKL